MSHFRSYSKTTYNVAIAVFFMMMIKGMYTKEAPFPKSGPQCKKNSDLWTSVLSARSE